MALDNPVTVLGGLATECDRSPSAQPPGLVTPTLLEVIRNENHYRSRNWEREVATRYVLGFRDAVVEASFFQHYQNSHHVKDVVELPTSFGCPVGCRHCASAFLRASRQLRFEELIGSFEFIAERHAVQNSDRVLVTFSGIGEGAFQKPNLSATCRAISSAYPRAYFTLTTVGFDPSFVSFAALLAREIELHYLQISYLHYEQRMLLQIIPRAEMLGFDFEKLVEAIRRERDVNVRLNYVVISRFNDSRQDAEGVAARLEGLQDRLVLRVSRLNETEPSKLYSLIPPTVDAVLAVRDVFRNRGFTAYEFVAARNDNLNCGQLAGTYKRMGGHTSSVSESGDQSDG